MNTKNIRIAIFYRHIKIIRYNAEKESKDMITIPCRKCGSTDVRKNGLTGGGAQKYHCNTCGFYGTLITQEDKQKKKEELIEKLLSERMSQRGIARLVGVSRNRVVALIKKKAGLMSS
jgi:transposase-like protein